ncbi:MAG: hypothetical protein RR237_00770 [Acetivibrio sp.]
MYTDTVDFSMDVVERHLYTNDCCQRLEEVHEANIERIVLDPEETLNYVISKYNLKEKLGNIN